jgi:GTP-binding protein
VSARGAAPKGAARPARGSGPPAPAPGLSGSFPTVCLVGRPNVGKSSLFNRLLRRSAALVDDRPGVTRDRHFAPLLQDGRRGLLVDTGGFDFSDLDPLAAPVTAQIRSAVAQADLVVLVCDGLTGLHPHDADLADLIRRSGRPAAVCVNKIDGPGRAPAALEFHALGLEPVLAVSAAHGFGLEALRALLSETLAPDEPDAGAEGRPTRVAVIGRPNAGKSSLVNKLCGQDRLVVHERPGTTRDAIDVDIESGDRRYTLVDTAGVRRRGRVSEKLEKLSVMRAIKGVEGSDVAVLVIDALEGVADQDAHIAGYAHERGRPLIILANKWDAVKGRAETRKSIEREMELKMVFLERAPFLTVSALSGAGLQRLLPLVDSIMAQYVFRAPTSEVNQVVERAVAAHTPPYAGRSRLKFFYATQASTRPPTFVVFANRPESVHFSYRRFLVNRLKEAFGLELVPVRLHVRDRHEEGRTPRRRAGPAGPAGGDAAAAADPEKAGRAAEPPAGKASAKPAAKAAKPTSGKPSAKPAAKAAKPASGKPSAKPAAKAAAKASKPASGKPSPKPAVKKPAAKKPAAKKPAAKSAKPAAKASKPASGKPSAKPAAKKPATKKPAARKTTAKPASGRPSAKPAAKKPAAKAAKPASVKPSVKPAAKASKPAASKGRSEVED